MPFSGRPIRTRRERPRLQLINSPLSRSAFSLTANSCYLFLLHYGLSYFRASRGASQDASQGDVPQTMNGPRLFWWAEGPGQELVAETGARGTLLSVPKISLTQALPPTPLGDQMRRTLSQNFDVAIDRDAKITDLIGGFAQELSNDAPGADLAAAQYLTLTLIHLWRIARQDIVSPGGAPQGLSERFVLLAGQRMRDHWTVQNYASELGVSRDRLGSAVKRATGLSPQAYLHRLLLREAMELLANTGTPVAQIAFRLGFVDPAYFTRFFKRETGQNPGEFRKGNCRPQNRLPESFAAWP